MTDLIHNKPAIVHSNSATGAANWQTWRNITLSNSGLHYVKTRRHPQNRKYITYCTVVRGGLKQVICTENFVKFGHVVFDLWSGQADIDRQTDRPPIATLHTLTKRMTK